MHNQSNTVYFILVCAAGIAATVPFAQAQQTWSEQTTAAAMGYCLARHPYIPRNPADPFTAEGFEILASPGVLGAVRRNYVFQRGNPSVLMLDPGQNQNCTQACRQFGLNYGTIVGRPLNYRDSAGNLIPDGIGDMASLAYRDFDFYNNQSVIAGMWGRPLNYHQSDVAQADLCCCQLDTSTPPPPKEACIDFEQPLIVGTQYGPAAGQSPGDTAILSNNIKMTVEKFIQSNGNTAFNDAHIDNVLVPGASGQSLRSNNISLRFDLTGLGFQANSASLSFLDLGGSENLAANDDAPHTGDIELAPASIGGAAVAVSTAPATGGKSGTVKINGPLKSLTIGGQELWIDQICAAP